MQALLIIHCVSAASPTLFAPPSDAIFTMPPDLIIYGIIPTNFSPYSAYKSTVNAFTVPKNMSGLAEPMYLSHNTKRPSKLQHLLIVFITPHVLKYLVFDHLKSECFRYSENCQFQIDTYTHSRILGACTIHVPSLSYTHRITFVGRFKCIGRMSCACFKLHRSRSCNCEYECIANFPLQSMDELSAP